jgi:hypothetical protein
MTVTRGRQIFPPWNEPEREGRSDDLRLIREQGASATNPNIAQALLQENHRDCRGGYAV